MRRITVFIIIILSTLFFQSSLLAADSIKLLQRAYERGEMDFQTALNYKLYAVLKKNKNRLPKEYQSDEPIKSATPIIVEARENAHLLYKENEFILHRPTDSDDNDYYGDGIAVWTHNSSGGNFKIHYTEDTADDDAVYGSDGDQGTVPQYVTDLAGYLDNAWTQIITTMGYTAPPSDGTAGGDSRFDVYLVNMSSYGYTTYDSSPSNVYIVMDNDFTGFPANLDSDNRQGAQKITAAHEFFHASQFQYTTNLSANAWWMEATATWMEDVLYSSVKDYLNYTGRKYDDANDNGAWDSGETYYQIDGVTAAGTTGRSTSRWFDHPEYSLDSTSGTYEYGTIIWVKYLSERYGNSIIKSIWDGIGSGSTAMTAISNELTTQGTTLTSAFTAFQAKNYKRDYTDGAYYPIIKHAATYSSYPQSISGTLSHLSSNFYALKPDAGTTPLTLTFTDMNSGNLSVKLILVKSGGYDEQDVTLDSASVATSISNFGTSATYSKVIVIVMNISSSQDSVAYSISVSGSSSGSGSSGSSDDSGCGITKIEEYKNKPPTAGVLFLFLPSAWLLLRKMVKRVV